MNNLPMWVFDLDTLEFMLVNNAAIINYGYSRAEFGKMTIKDIRPPEAIELLHRELSLKLDSFQDFDNWEHIKADGSLIWVKITSFLVSYKNRPAKLVTAINVSHLIAEKDLLAQANKKIAWQQSHILRAPLANILALSYLLKIGDNINATDVIGLLEQEAMRLDQIIIKIVETAAP